MSNPTVLNLHGHGFTVTDVPRYLDEACKAGVRSVFKTEAAALKAADKDAVAYLDNEGAVAVQIDGFENLWFVVSIYTDEFAAKCKSHLDFKVAWAAKQAAAAQAN